MCLLGPNGAGKSTLMRSLAGLQPMLQGELMIAGEKAPHSAAFLSRQLAVVLSEFDGVGGLTVKELVEMGRAPYSSWAGRLGKRDHEIVSEAMAATEVGAFSHRKVGTLSDGERQRVMIARAMAQQTPLIMLDEPTSHLDIAHRVHTMRLLHRLTREHQKGILLSSHDLDLALQGADQLWILSEKGQMTIGAPEDLVLSDQLAQAYGTGGEGYDWKHGGLRLLAGGDRPMVLQGPEELLIWARRALAKIGWREGSLAESHDSLTAHGPAHWELKLQGQIHTAESLEEVLGIVRLAV